jgi:hypothetical protein
MGMTLYIAQKLTEARMRDLRAASARTVLPGATGAAGSGKRLARLSPGRRGLLREHATACPGRRHDAFAGR